MRRQRTITFSGPTIFALLMLGAGGAVLLPGEWLGPARNMTQLVALVQWPTQKARQAVTEPIRALSQQHLTAEQQAQLLLDRQGLENENAILRQRIEQLRNTIEELSLLRRYDFRQEGVLIPAPVIALDAAPRRDSIALGKGTLQGIRQDDWVTTRIFIQAGEEDGVRPDSAVLARESLIGWVEQTATLTSRVILLTDPYANRGMRVNIAHVDPRSRTSLHVTLDGRIADFLLRGAGGGRMIIPDIDKQFIEAGVVAVGDLVTSDPDDPRLHQALVIGVIEELRLNRNKPVVYEALVRPRYDARSLSQVLVVDLSRGAARDR